MRNNLGYKLPVDIFIGSYDIIEKKCITANLPLLHYCTVYVNGVVGAWKEPPRNDVLFEFCTSGAPEPDLAFALHRLTNSFTTMESLFHTTVGSSGPLHFMPACPKTCTLVDLMVPSRDTVNVAKYLATII